VFDYSAAISSGAPLFVLRGHTERVFSCSWSPLVPGLLATGSDDHNVILWKVDLDKDIKKALTFTELNTIKDRGLLQFIGKQLYKSNVSKPGTIETTANLNLGVEMLFLAQEQGSRYAGEFLKEVMADYSKAPSIIEKLQANADAERQKDADIKYNASINLLESGEESQYETGIKMLEFAAANGDWRAYIKLGEIYEEGTLINKDLAKALEWYTKGERKFPGVPEFGRKKDQIKTMQLVKSAGENI
jgi:hypothetical protein